MHSVQADIDWERPVAQVLAATALMKRRQQGQHRMPAHEHQPHQPAPLPSGPSTGRIAGGVLPEETPAAFTKAAGINALQGDEPGSSGTDVQLSSIMLGCMRRVFSKEFKQALLQCHAGEHAICLFRSCLACECSECTGCHLRLNKLLPLRCKARRAGNESLAELVILQVLMSVRTIWLHHAHLMPFG